MKNRENPNYFSPLGSFQTVAESPILARACAAPFAALGRSPQSMDAPQILAISIPELAPLSNKKTPA
jgi:hypothetical protein